MPSKFTVLNGNTTVEFSWTAPTATIQSIVGGCAEILHRRSGSEISFDTLTNTEKLTLVEGHLKDIIINLANANKVEKAIETARAAEEASKYQI